MKKLNIVFFGTPEFVIPLIETISKNFNLIGLVTTPDQILGREKILTPSPAKKHLMIKNFQGKIFTPSEISDELKDQLTKLKPDLFVVAAFGKIIPESLLSIPKYGSINIHPSLLPKYKGATPIQSAILAGDKTTGITIISMDEKMDHGPIIFQQEVILSQQDNNETLHNKLFQISAEVLPKVIRDFTSGKIKLQEQNHMEATFCKTLQKEDGFFDINNPPSLINLDLLIRAYYPWPTAWTKWSGKIVKFYPDNFIQIEGKPKTKFADFLRGYPNFPIKQIS